jgi:hypothetical protein
MLFWLTVLVISAHGQSALGLSYGNTVHHGQSLRQKKFIYLMARYRREEGQEGLVFHPL